MTTFQIFPPLGLLGQTLVSYVTQVDVIPPSLTHPLLTCTPLLHGNFLQFDPCLGDLFVTFQREYGRQLGLNCGPPLA